MPDKDQQQPAELAAEALEALEDKTEPAVAKDREDAATPPAHSPDRKG